MQGDGWFGDVPGVTSKGTRDDGRGSMAAGSGPGATTNALHDLLDSAVRDPNARIHPEDRGAWDAWQESRHADDIERNGIQGDMERAGVKPEDSQEVAAQKLADYRETINQAEQATAARAHDISEDVADAEAEGDFDADGWQREPEEDADAETARGQGDDEIPLRHRRTAHTKLQERLTRGPEQHGGAEKGTGGPGDNPEGAEDARGTDSSASSADSGTATGAGREAESGGSERRQPDRDNDLAGAR